MLRRTFIHADGVGPLTEIALWKAGAQNWATFLTMYRDGRWRDRRMDNLAQLLQQSEQALQQGKSDFFAERLPSREQWRLYPDFKDRAAFFDIETTGLTPCRDPITVIGLYDRKRYRAFVCGQDLEEFPEVASHYPLLVSFNGAQFDMPFLQREFRSFRPLAHIDIRFPLARLGYKGGLKKIEQAIGLKRPKNVSNLTGWDAVQLWEEHKRGKTDALKTLIAYNRCDVENLALLADFTIEKMMSIFLTDTARLTAR